MFAAKFAEILENEHHNDESPNDYSIEEAPPKEISWWEKLRKKIFEKQPNGRSDDYYVSLKYHPNASPPIRMYLKFAKKCRKIVQGDVFNLFIVGVICVAGVLVGMETYPTLAASSIVQAIDNSILGIFCFEIGIKVAMEGLAPWKYFSGDEWKWNCFDFTIVFLSFPFWDGLFGGGSIALLRLVRLARLGKLIRKLPALQMIIQGLMGGLQSIAYIMVLIFLVYYLYAVMGFYLFAVNDPFHFGTVPLAMLTLFRISTLDNWGDILYQNMFGCVYYPDVYFSGADEAPELTMLWCKNPSPQPYLSVVYFVTFVILSALVMLSLFIGVVTLSMSESMEELRKNLELQKQEEAFENNKKRMLAIKRASPPVGGTSRRLGMSMTEFRGEVSPSDFAMLRTESPQLPVEDKAEDDKDDEDQEDDDGDGDETSEQIILNDTEHLVVVKEMASRNPFYYIYALYLEHKIRKLEAQAAENSANIAESLHRAMGNSAESSTDDSSSFHLGSPKSEALDKADERYKNHPAVKLYLHLGFHCRQLATHAWFNNFMTFVIVLASLNVGAQTDNRVTSVAVMASMLNVLDTAILSIFTFEVGLKVIGEGLHPLNYFKDGWNKFDFLIVAGSYIPGAGSTVTILRLLRLLRILKLVKRLPQLAVIVNALLMSMESIGYVGLVLFLFFYLFAIVGMMLFSLNDPWHFGTLHISLITLFRYATLDSSMDVCYVNMFGCDLYSGIYGTFPTQCKKPVAHGFLAAFYFVIFTIIGAQVLLSLFIGVIATSMDEANARQHEEQQLDERIAKTAAKLMLTPVQVDAFRTVFSLLDLDGGGTIDEEELKLGLDAINAGLPDDQIIAILRNVDPEGTGVDVAGFIDFMHQTPHFKKDTAAVLAVGFMRKQVQKKKEPWHQFMSDLLYYGGKANRLEVERIEAAYKIQDCWHDYQSRKAAKAEVERKKAELLEKERLKKEKMLRDKASSGSSVGSKSSHTKSGFLSFFRHEQAAPIAPEESSQASEKESVGLLSVQDANSQA